MAQKYQILQATVTEANQKVKLVDYLDKDYKLLTGIAMVDLYGWKGEFAHSSVDGKELFPRDFDTLFVQTNNFVNPSERFFTMEDVEANGKKIEIEYLDGGVASYPYKLKVYLRLENQPNGK